MSKKAEGSGREPAVSAHPEISFKVIADGLGFGGDGDELFVA